MKLNIQSYNLNKIDLKKNKNISLTTNNGFIFIGRYDGYIDILNNDLQPICLFQSHPRSFDVLQNSEISESIKAVDTYDSGCAYETLLVSNDNLLKIWALKLNSDIPQKRLLKSLPNYLSYTVNSLNVKNDNFLVSDYLTIKLFDINTLQSLTLMNLKGNQSASNYNLITQSKYLDDNLFAYSQTSGKIFFNDLRTKISSENVSIYDHNDFLDSKYKNLLHSINDFQKNGNFLYGRNVNSIAIFDIRKGFLDRKILEKEENLFDKNNTKAAYEKYSIDLWNNKIITGMTNTINMFDKDHHVIKLPGGDNTCFVKNLGKKFCTFYSGKLLFFKPK